MPHVSEERVHAAEEVMVEMLALGMVYDIGAVVYREVKDLRIRDL